VVVVAVADVLVASVEVAVFLTLPYPDGGEVEVALVDDAASVG